MIDKNEIDKMADELGVKTSSIQRDYVHGWLISAIYSASPLADRLVLKGGNCLRKAYFESARYSSDLDFSVSNQIPDDMLGRELNAICACLNKKTGVEFDISRTRIEKKQQADKDKSISEVRLYFRDFYGHESKMTLKVRLDITEFDRLYLPVQERQLIHLYSDSEVCSVPIKCAKLEEVLASKLRCLLQRRHVADLFDLLYAIMVGRSIKVDRSQVLSTFFKITVFDSSPGIVKGLLIDLPMKALGQLWNRFIDCPQKTWFSFETAEKHFASLVESFFPERAIHDYSEMYFPSALRIPILEAGDSFTMLELTYDGFTRLVEPYSLVFKTRKDGEAKEYLYVYDTTGGSSGPGLKCFIPGKVESIQNTDQSFEPRVEVVLKKAGGIEIAREFERKSQGRFRSSSPRAPRKSSLWSQIYTIECPYCSKRFKRTNYSNTRIRPHKDQSGYPCSGRKGYIV